MRNLLIASHNVVVDENILAQHSEYFKNLFFGSFKERGATEIKMNVVCPEIAVAIIQSLNDGQILSSIASEHILEILEIENYFGITSNIKILDKLKVPENDFIELLHLVDIFGYRYHLVRSILYNLPPNYEISDHILLEKMKQYRVNNYLINVNEKQIMVWDLERQQSIFDIPYEHQTTCRIEECVYHNIARDVYISDDLKYLIYLFHRKLIITDTKTNIAQIIEDGVENLSYHSQHNLICYIKDRLLIIEHIETNYRLVAVGIPLAYGDIKFSKKGDMIYLVNDNKFCIVSVKIDLILEIHDQMKANPERSIIEYNNTAYYSDNIRVGVIECFQDNHIIGPVLNFGLHSPRLAITPKLLSYSFCTRYLAILYYFHSRGGFAPWYKYYLKIYDLQKEELIHEDRHEDELIFCEFWQNYLIICGKKLIILDMDQLKEVYRIYIQISKAFITRDHLYMLSNGKYYLFNLTNQTTTELDHELPLAGLILMLETSMLPLNEETYHREYILNNRYE